MSKDEVLEATLNLLKEKPELAETLRQITEYEEKHYRNEFFFTLGWEWNNFNPPLSPQTLHMMHLRGILRNVYKSRSSTGYVTRHPTAVIEALEIFDSEQEPEAVTSTEEEIPPDLFNPIVGYDDVKSTILRALDKGARVHWLFLGPPASAKTLFLLCLERLPGSGYVLGSRMSRAGLSDYLFNCRPRFLLLDEIDKLPNKDLAPLLSLMENGRVVETLYGRRREVVLNTVVFGAANRISLLSPELLSRFEVLEFPEYTYEQFIEVCVNLLQREGADRDLAKYIGEAVWNYLVKDVREAVRIARLAEDDDEVDDLVEILKKYQPKRED